MSNKLVKLDRLDRRLLFELDQNSSQSYRTLGKKLSSPPETIRYRINNLLKQGVIQNFLTVIDAGKLGNGYYKVFLKLHNIDEAGVEKIINYLVNNDRVNWVARVDGLYDISFTIRVKQVIELSNFIDHLKKTYYQVIHKLIFAVNIEVDFLLRNYLTGSKNSLKHKTTYTSPEEPAALDATDINILRLIATTTRRKDTEIAKALEITSETVAKRIRKLEKNKVITRYRLVLNNQVLGQINYYILIYLNYVSEKRVKAFQSFCRNHPNIVYFIKALGEWDYELNIEISSLQEYRGMMMEITKQFSDIVRDYYGMPVSRIYKFTITP